MGQSRREMKQIHNASATPIWATTPMPVPVKNRREFRALRANPVQITTSV